MSSTRTNTANAEKRVKIVEHEVKSNTLKTEAEQIEHFKKTDPKTAELMKLKAAKRAALLAALEDIDNADDEASMMKILRTIGKKSKESTAYTRAQSIAEVIIERIKTGQSIDDHDLIADLADVRYSEKTKKENNPKRSKSVTRVVFSTYEVFKPYVHFEVEETD